MPSEHIWSEGRAIRDACQCRSSVEIVTVTCTKGRSLSGHEVRALTAKDPRAHGYRDVDVLMCEDVRVVLG